MNRIVRRCLLSLSLFSALVLITTCSGGGGGSSGNSLPPDEYSAVLFSTTKTLSASSLANLAEVTTDGTFRFTGASSEVTAVKAQDVIIGGISDKTPYGFLRFVTSVGTNVQGDLLLYTMPAPVQLAFQKLHVKMARSIPDIGAAATGMAGPLKFGSKSAMKVGIWPPAVGVDYYPFNGDNDPLSADDQVHVTGTLSGGVDYTFGIDVDWGAVTNIPQAVQDCAQSLFIGCDPIPEAIVNFGISGSLKADLSTQGVSFLPYTKDVPVYGPVYFTPIQIGLITLLPEFEISSKIEGAASSQFTTGLSLEADAGVGVSISSKKLIPSMSPQPYATVTATAPTVDATLDAYSKVRLGPQISLKLEGFAGPRAGMFGFAELKASQDNVAQGMPCYSLNSGVEGELGFTIGVDFPILGSVTLADWNLTSNLWTHEETSGACTGTSSTPANILQNPTFTPWAKAFGNTVEPTGIPSTAPGGRIAGTVLEQTIDGHFVVAGSGSKGLLKIDDQGNTVWSKRFIGPLLGDPFISELLPDHVTYTEDAAMFVTAYPWALLKVDAGGNLVWAKQFPFVPNNSWWRISNMAPDGSGGVYLAASYGTDGTKPLDVDTLVARLDSSGTVSWLRRIGDAGVGEVPRIAVPFHGGLVVAGEKCTLDAAGLCGAWTLWAIDFDSGGNVLWSRQYPLAASGASVFPLTGLEAVDGDLIIGGTIEMAPQRSFFAKIKPDGTMSFLTAYKKVYTVNLEDLALTSLVALPTSGYIAAGTHTPYPSSLGRDLWIASLDGIGQIQWIRQMRTPDDTPPTVPPTGSDELMPSILYTSDGGAFVAGYTEEEAGGGAGFWTLKGFAKDGTISFTAASGITEESLPVVNDTATFCVSQCAGVGTSWSPLNQNFTAGLGDIQVTVENLSVAVTQQSP